MQSLRSPDSFRLAAPCTSGKIVDAVIKRSRDALGNFFRPSLITILQCLLPIDAPFRSANGCANATQDDAAAVLELSLSKPEGMAMTEDEERKARERDEIAARVAAFRATQEKFKREREEYFVSTLENARKVERPSLWP
jgi:hypothetical protein